jgi:multidrug resistance efflux pump
MPDQKPITSALQAAADLAQADDTITTLNAEIDRLRAELAKADARLEIVKGFVDNQIEQVRNAGR